MTSRSTALLSIPSTLGPIVALGLALAPAAGCAWSEGEPFASVSAQLDAEFDMPADRDLGMGWQALASSYELHIDTLSIEVADLVLLDGGSSGLNFDPANPPPGYSLCHNGHCHADDGRLVDYEDIAIELAEGGGATPVASIPIGALDLVAGVSQALSCELSCDLGLGTLALGNVSVLGLQATGRVRDGRSPGRIEGEIPWTANVVLSGDETVVLSAQLNVPIERGEGGEIALSVSLRPSTRMFDDIAWAELTPADLGGAGDGFDMAADGAARAALITARGEGARELSASP
ncbi:MAG: hypothetical protein AAGC55_14865 [Myxococcota bacterium]